MIRDDIAYVLLQHLQYTLPNSLLNRGLNVLYLEYVLDGILSYDAYYRRTYTISLVRVRITGTNNTSRIRPQIQVYITSTTGPYTLSVVGITPSIVGVIPMIVGVYSTSVSLLVLGTLGHLHLL